MAATLIQVIRTLVPPPCATAVSDRDLLERFVTRGDEAAFTALVKRHGPMVLRVCRRILRGPSDTEDAFQATFLVLVQKARTIAKPDLLANWLYGVAYRTALKAKAASRERQQRECVAADMKTRAVWADAPPDDLGPVVDEEISRLPEKYRAPFVLCCLEGKTNEDAAQVLGCPRGTVLSRLARARARLRVCLTRRGLAPGAGLGALMLEKNLAPAALPLALVSNTVKTALEFAAGQVLAKASIVLLAKGVMKSMFMTKLKAVSVLVCALGAITVGTGLPIYRALAVHGTGPGQEAAIAEPSQEAVKPQPNHEAANQNRPLPAPAALAVDLSIEEISTEAAGPGETVKGSGKLISKEFKIADFSSVAAGHAFHVDIVKGDSYSVKITVDDNLLADVTVVKDGTTLRIGLNTKNKSYHQARWKATVTTPRLEGINLDGASRATLQGFDSAKGFTANLNGASHLAGDIKADKATLAVSGASTVKLKGSAREGTLRGSGASALELKDFILDSANTHLSGASRATVTVREKLDYDLSGASNLSYQGNPTMGKKVKTGASRVHSEK